MDESDHRFATAFGAAAEEYERGRPGYPSSVIADAAASPGLDSSADVLDLAAGTGKLTGELAKHFGRVVAVEPLAEMRSILAKQVPTAEALEGSAESIPAADGSFDAVFVAQAFHWFDGPVALLEISRVLRPRGELILIWNTTPWERRETPWFALVDDLLEQSRAELSVNRRQHSGSWREVFEDDELFEPLTHAEHANPRRVNRDDFVADLASRSYVSALSVDDRADVVAGLHRLLDRDDAPISDGLVAVPMTTHVFTTRLKT